jgi:hypothetical protein
MTLLPYSFLAKCGNMVFAICSMFWVELFIAIFHLFKGFTNNLSLCFTSGSSRNILPPLGLLQFLLFRACTVALDLDVRQAESADQVRSPLLFAVC